MKTVLFVCVHNAGRSQIAEAFFNQLAKGKAKALSAGISPTDVIDSIVIEVMREVGIDTSANKPKALIFELVKSIDKVLTMGCGAEEICSTAFIEPENWELEVPRGKPLERAREIRDKIKTKVIKILEEITRET
jgi:protein-tyrosine-phosphatase